MVRGAAWSILLTVGLALALPLAVVAWLGGGHVTPEQAAGHALAVIERGHHQHALVGNPGAAAPGPATHLTVSRRAEIAAGPLLTTQTAGGLFALWQAVVASGLALTGLAGWWRHQRRLMPRPASYHASLPLPPPRARWARPI